MVDPPLMLVAAVFVALFVVFGRRQAWVGGVLLAAATLTAVVALVRVDMASQAPAVRRTADRALSGANDQERPIFSGDPLNVVNARHPKEAPHGDYVGASACRECHAHYYETWHDTYHRTMTQVVSPGMMLGDFSPQRLTNHASGKVIELGHAEGLYTYAEVDAVSGRAGQPLPLVLATGSHNMQAYWYPAVLGDSLGLMPFVHVVADNRWIPREAAFITPPNGNFGHEVGRWNEVCFRCHTTGGESRRVAMTTLHESRVSEYGISCEACHQTGRGHVEYQRRRQVDSTFVGKDPILNPASMTPRESIDMCGNCHRAVVFEMANETGNVSRHRMGINDADYQHFVKHAAEEGEAKQEELIREATQTFWADGMVRVAGRESNGVEEAPCHKQGGMTCTHCHSLHRGHSDSRSAKDWANDLLAPNAYNDTACLKCHDGTSYAAGAHTHHQAGSPGSRCYNCHMPHTSFGLLKATRSHRVSNPSVAETVRVQRQNACNICHIDRSLAWTAQHLSEWYGSEVPKLSNDQRRYSSVALAALQGDASLRALAAWYLGWQPAVDATGGDWAPRLLTILMEDDYNAVRYIAGRSLKRWPGFESSPFDFVAAPAQRGREIAAIRELWKSRHHAGKGGATMFGKEDGGFDEAEIARLLGSRDNRPTFLPE